MACHLLGAKPLHELTMYHFQLFLEQTWVNILIKIQPKKCFNKMQLKMSSAKSTPFCPSPKVLTLSPKTVWHNLTGPQSFISEVIVIGNVDMQIYQIMTLDACWLSNKSIIGSNDGQNLLSAASSGQNRWAMEVWACIWLSKMTPIMTCIGTLSAFTGLLWAESTGHRWIPVKKGQWCGFLMFSLFAWTRFRKKKQYSC